MKSKLGLPLLLMLVLALTRIPGLMPPNFSAVYGLLFCGGVYLIGRVGWWLPLVTMLATDIGLGVFYYVTAGVSFFQPYLLVNYAVYLALIGLGRCFTPRSSWLNLLGGGVLGAILFYLLTNTAAWFLNPFGNPEYTRDLAGWIIALTKGTAGYAQTWEFFRNTLLSGGLFTGLFAGAMKLAAALEPQEVEPEEPAAAPEPAPEGEEVKA